MREIADREGVSEATIRRDRRELARREAEAEDRDPFERLEEVLAEDHRTLRREMRRLEGDLRVAQYALEILPHVEGVDTRAEEGRVQETMSALRVLLLEGERVRTRYRELQRKRRQIQSGMDERPDPLLAMRLEALDSERWDLHRTMAATASRLRRTANARTAKLFYWAGFTKDETSIHGELKALGIS